MANPFPGMNPYLKDCALWNDVHHRVITCICDALQPQRRLQPVAATKEGVYTGICRSRHHPRVA
jgi:hypothetical protein